jgi:hypothetical protein
MARLGASLSKLLIHFSLWTLAIAAPTSHAQNLSQAGTAETLHFSQNSLLLEVSSIRSANLESAPRTIKSAVLGSCNQPDFSPRSTNSEYTQPPSLSFMAENCGLAKSSTRATKYSLAPVNPCGAFPYLETSAACLPGSTLGMTPWNGGIMTSNPMVLLARRPVRERFHMGSAMWQSLEFLLVEHAFRLANDPYARYLLFHKPFWHDYLASAGNFEMSRWGDGDNFLVNYIGHPLEGSVSGNIFIQNDPRGRAARFGKNSEYWNSRLKAMAWAAAYSAYFEIGPVLSEAALGNEGGYTYIPHCGYYPTCRKEPGESYKPPTNNTGWVDFVVTPTAGMGWIILEDFLDTRLVDKLAGDGDALKYKILRGALTPSRSMSNFLAGKPPWHRYYGPREVAEAFGSSLKSGQRAPRPEWQDDPRWGLGLHMTSASFPMDWPGCTACSVFVPGVGFDLSYRLTRMMYLNSEFNIFPGSGAPHGRGGAQEVLAGIKVGRTMHSWGLFTQFRPGFVHYDQALIPGSFTEYDGTTRFAFDLGGSVEYYASHHSSIRFDVGTTLIHYLTAQADPKQPPVSVLSPDYYTTQGSFHVTSGYVFRF